MLRLRYFLAIILLCNMALSASASSIHVAVAQVDGMNNCISGDTLEEGLTRYCRALLPGFFGEATGRSEPGSVGGSAYVWIQSNIPDSAGGQMRASFGASFSDRLYFGQQSGTVRIPVDFAGTLRGTLGRFSGALGASTGYGNIYNSAYADPLGTKSFNIPFANGYVDFSVSIAGFVNCGGGAWTNYQISTGCEGRAYAMNSARVLGVTLFDENMVKVESPDIRSESGFDYLTGLQPHDIPPIPLPASLLLTVGALSTFGALKLRR